MDTMLKRRQFLRVTALAGGGLLVACGGGSSSSPSPTPPDSSNPDPAPGNGGNPAETFAVGEFLRISSDNSIRVLVGASEIGQGALTAIPMIVAEELDADWSRVTSAHSPVAAQFDNPYFGALQFTVASAATRGYFAAQRRAGAAVRHMLIAAAAERWNVEPSTLRTEKSFVIDDANQRSASYGDLAEAAAAQNVPINPPLKDPANYTIIGSTRQRLDAVRKTNGSEIYGMDVDIPGMLTAVIARPPRFFGQPQSVNSNAALAIPGVLEVFTIPSGVAVIANDFWSAEQGRKALEVSWNEALAGRTDSAQTRSNYQASLNLPGVPVRSDGAVLLAQAAASDVLSADYFFPFMAHAAMEPLNVTVDYTGSAAEIWTGSQSQTIDRLFAASILGLLPEQINFHTMTSGGGFGRRGNPLSDYVRDACHVAKTLQQPVKVIWTREDDMKGGYYRPAASVRVSAALDNNGTITAWTHRAVTQDVTSSLYFEEQLDTLAEMELPPLGELNDLETGMPYAIDNVHMDAHLTLIPQMPSLWMRSVNKFSDVFAQETFIDEIAHRYSRDPYHYRREMLGNNPRLLAVLDGVAQAANWGNPPAGRSQGIALIAHWQSYIAQVVEVSVTGDRELKVHRVVSAIDCGTAVNPDLVVAQVESGVIFALSSVLFGEIELRDGVVQQSNFDDYPVLRMHQTPQIDTVLMPSGDNPGGVGEIGVPAVGPALANAIFAATGEQIRELPLKNLNFVIA